MMNFELRRGTFRSRVLDDDITSLDDLFSDVIAESSDHENEFKVYMTRNFLSPSGKVKNLLKQCNNFFCSFSFSFF